MGKQETELVHFVAALLDYCVRNLNISQSLTTINQLLLYRGIPVVQHECLRAVNNLIRVCNNYVMLYEPMDSFCWQAGGPIPELLVVFLAS